MPRVTVHSTIYCSKGSLPDEEAKVLARLAARGWNIDASSTSEYSGNGFYLAVPNPWDVTISKGDATTDKAAADIKQALYETGNWSVAGSVCNVVSIIADKAGAIVDAGTNLANHPEAVGAGIGLVIVGALVVGLGYLYLTRRAIP